MTSLSEEHNPYAAPEAELLVQGVQATPAAFYPMSPRKAAVMSVLTLGLYDLVFWYLHWKRLKDSGHNVTPAFRAFFAGFTSFTFVTTLCATRTERGLDSSADLSAGPAIYLALNIGARLSDKVLEGVPSLVFTMLACLGGAWVLATVQRAANEVLAADKYQGPSNSGATLGAIVSGAIGLVAWFFVILGTVSPESLDLE